VGKGGFGRVSPSWSESKLPTASDYSDSEYVVKVMDTSTYEKYKAAWKEIKMLIRLSGDYIVTVEGWVEVPKTGPGKPLGLLLYMKRCPQTLNEKLSEGGSDYGSLKKAEDSTELLQSVKYLHKIHILHGDLKPDNILVKPGGKGLLIADFDLAHDLAAAEQEGKLSVRVERATKRFAAPELFEAAFNFEYPLGKALALDSFGLGVTLVVMHSPELHKAVSKDQSLEAHQVHHVLGQECVPHGVCKSIHGLICEDPEKRLAVTKIIAISPTEWFVLDKDASSLEYAIDVTLDTQTPPASPTLTYSSLSNESLL